MKQLYTLFLGSLFLFSCSEIVEQPSAPSLGEPINMRIKLSATPMLSMGGDAATRAAGAEGDALSVQWGADQTRAAVDKVDKTAAESKIHNAWLLQFNGTAGNSTLIAAPQKLTVDPDGYADCQTVSGSIANRLYVVANVDEAMVNKWTTSTTLSAFESTSFTQGILTATDVNTKGLPMAAYQDLTPTTALTGSFPLKSRMAKVTFQYTVGSNLSTYSWNATLRGVPNKLSCKVADPTANAQQPYGATYVATHDLTAATTTAMTVYVPENLAGQKASVTTELQRSTANAQANSMYIELAGGTEAANQITLTSYVIYLGNIVGSKGDFNVQGNCAYSVVVGIKGTNSTTDKRVVTATYKNLSLDAANKAATANCYVVTAAGNYYIDATVMGNGVETPAHEKTSVSGDFDFDAITPLPLSPVLAGVLWESVNTTDAPAPGTIASGAKIYKSSKLLFTAGATPGNAVIAAKDASGTIIWSWHIWRTATTPVGVTLNAITSTDGTFTAPTLKMMDRSLGALRATPNSNVTQEQDYGLYYQWGRKDPFQTQGGVATAGGGSSITPADAVKNPATYYIINGDWTTRNDNLWGCPLTEIVTISGNRFNKNAGSKTIYDPCPVGWRVAPSYAFANATKENSPWDATNKGRNFAQITTSAGTPFFFSASGSRYYNNGTLFYAGIVGYICSSSLDATNTNGGSRFSFSDLTVVPHGEVRASGFTARCVQD